MTEKIPQKLGEKIIAELQARADGSSDWDRKVAFLHAVGIVKKHVASDSE